MLELHEQAGHKAGGVPAQCVHLTDSATRELVGLGDEAAALTLATATGVHEGTELLLSVAAAADGGRDRALGLPENPDAGARAVGRLRRRLLGVSMDTSEAEIVEVLAALALPAEARGRALNELPLEQRAVGERWLYSSGWAGPSWMVRTWPRCGDCQSASPLEQQGHTYHQT